MTFHQSFRRFLDYHDHDFFEFFLVTSGSYRHYFKHKDETLKKGDAYLIRPGDEHSLHNLQDNSSRLFTITDKSMREFCAFMGKELYEDLFVADALTCALSDQRIKKILNLCFIIQHCLKNDPDKAELASSLLFQLIMEVVIDQNDILEKQRPAWLINLLKAIQATENQSWRVADVVKNCNDSHSQISRAFQTYLNCSISEYLNEVKMQSAIDYLFYSDLTIYNITYA